MDDMDDIDVLRNMPQTGGRETLLDAIGREEERIARLESEILGVPEERMRNGPSRGTSASPVPFLGVKFVSQASVL